MENVIRSAVFDAVSQLGFAESDFVVEHPTDLSHGDYACNVAMVLAKSEGKVPREIAEQILPVLEGQIEYVEKIEIAGPGFLNFHLSRDFFVQEIIRANKEGDNWGHTDTYKDQKVFVEYTDPNPFKEFHIGHLFTNTVGESIARLFVAAGAEVKRLNYQGDVGMHVACAIYGMQQLGIAADSDFSAKDLGKAYALGATAIKENEKVAAEVKTINKAVYERSEEAINSLYDKGRAVSLEYFDEIYKILGTEFDQMFFESEAGPKGRELVLANPDIFPESDGAKIFRGEEYGLHTRVFVNREGLPTYEAKELALAKMKEDVLGTYDLSIVSTSNEISEYFKVLKKAMSFVYPDLAKKTEHIGHGTVRLASGKMSSRTGDVIAAKDFIADIAEAAMQKLADTNQEVSEDLANDIAIAAIKYATLKSNILQDTVFDKEQALSFEGNSGPYLQYTHARINALLDKAESVGVTPEMSNYPETPYAVERLIYRLPSVIERSVSERSPHLLAHYLIELASMFNSFYATEKVADSADKYASYKAAISQVVKQTLKNGLWILGINAPERM